MSRMTFTHLSILTAIVCLSTFSSAQATDHKHKAKFKGPLIINNAYLGENGNVITGNFKGTLTQPAISVITSNPVTIQNATLEGPGDLIYVLGGNVTVLNTTGVSTNPNQVGVRKGMFLHVEQAINVLVQNCNIQGARFGVYINRYIGNYTHNQTIKIINNVVSNTDGRPSNGNGGYVTNGEFNSHAFQLNAIPGVPNMEIAWNQVINQPYQSQSSDIINIYDSGGTPASHLLVHDNYVQGAFPTKPGVDRYSGGGIITDGNNNLSAPNPAAYIDIYNNRVVATANYGLAIAAGHDNNIYNNRVISSGRLADGTFYPMTYANAVYN